jgi:hypothetical protein
MSRYDRLIGQLYSDPADAALAKRFVAQFEHEPMMDGRLEASCEKPPGRTLTSPAGA